MLERSRIADYMYRPVVRFFSAIPSFSSSVRPMVPCLNRRGGVSYCAKIGWCPTVTSRRQFATKAVAPRSAQLR